jgi:predicted DCC family thiol-disulfide oxidoreductase YuxK
MLSPELAAAVLEGGCRGEVGLTALYDERCPLCRRLRAWLQAQAMLVPIEFLAAGGAEARRRYPLLDHARTTRVLTVVASDGAVFEGERAWLVCAWSLPAWQPLTEVLGGRAGRALVRLCSRAVDHYRHHLVGPPYGTSCASCQLAAPPGGGRGR